MQLLREESDVSSSRDTLSVFQLRFEGSMPGEDDFGVGLEEGAGDEVPFERAPLGMLVTEEPVASFCSLTI